MQRNLSIDFSNALSAESQYSFYLYEFNFDSGVVRYTNAHTDVVYNGNTFLATADLVSSGDITESQSLDITTVSFTLSAVDQTLVAQALQENFTDRLVTVYKGFMDTNSYTVIADPIPIYEGHISSFRVSEDPDSGTSSLVWATSSVWADFQRTSGRRTNTNDQEVFFPGDKGFEFTYQVTDEVKWGRP